MSRKFGFRVRCFLGPTGALRIPIQQFTGEMIQALSQQVSSDSREYELLRTEHCDSNVSGDPRTLASTGRSQVREPTPFPGAVSRDISLSNDGRPFEARQNRIYVTTQGDPSMESHGSTSNVDHHPSNRPSGDYVPEHGGASRSVGSTDDRVWRATGCPAVGCGGDSSRTTPSRAISARVQGADLITNSIQLVTSDIHTSTGTTSSATYASHSQDKSTKIQCRQLRIATWLRCGKFQRESISRRIPLSAIATRMRCCSCPRPRRTPIDSSGNVRTLGIVSARSSDGWLRRRFVQTFYRWELRSRQWSGC